MPVDLKKVKSCKIHPAIGIARVGDHPTEFFIGPETPGLYTPPPTYKSGTPPAIKRQGARFRIFAYDAANKPLGELSSADATITWKVHLVNAKAEWDTFEGREGETLPLDQRRPGHQRNKSVKTGRESLIIDGGIQTAGPNQTARFAGHFQNVPVELGEIRCDAGGRLLVLGGFGKSETVTSSLITHYANNDGWHDDTSDGPVEASVVLTNGARPDVAPAWVIVAPPDFVPGMTNVVTLWDVMQDVATTRGVLPAPANPSFTKDVYPILSRTCFLHWVNDLASSGHSPNTSGDFSSEWALLANKKSKAAKDMREFVFNVVRDPRLLAKVVEGKATKAEEIAAQAQATFRFMPALSGDSGDSVLKIPDRWLTVTKRQYDILALWNDGKFIADWKGVPAAPPPTVSPEGLDRAALENSTGGPLFPGIECGWIARHAEIYAPLEVARLNPANLKAGDMTKRMAVPWQADFFECNEHWWPSQRPDVVFGEADFAKLMNLDQEIAKTQPGSTERTALEAERANLLTERSPWWPKTWPQNEDKAEENKGDRAMVDRWHRLGYVVPKQSAGETVFVNTEFVA
jgi:hypothetical protein